MQFARTSVPVKHVKLAISRSTRLGVETWLWVLWNSEGLLVRGSAMSEAGARVSGTIRAQRLGATGIEISCK